MNVIATQLDCDLSEARETLSKDGLVRFGNRKVSYFRQELTQHLRPLSISSVINGLSMRRVLVDNGAAVNILPQRIL